MLTFFSSLPRFILVLLLCSLLIVGCGVDQSGNDGKSQLVVASPSSPTTFNPPLNDSLFSVIVFGYLYEGLTATNGLTSEIEPALAESWQVAEDGKRIVFNLRSGLKWSDGEPLTAEDVEFTYNEIYLNNKIPTGVRDILRVGESGQFPTVKKLNDRQVEFTVPETFAPFLRYAGGITILPKHALKDAIRNLDRDGNPKFLTTWGTDTNPKQIIGNGYYRLVKYVPSQRVVLEKNPYYWRKDAQGNSQPYIDRVVIRIIESDQTQLIAFRSGDLDSLEIVSEAFSLMKKEEAKGKYTIYNGGPLAESRFFIFNLNQAINNQGKPFVDPIKSVWFNNLSFRQAIAYAIDRQGMLNNIYRGIGAIQNSPIEVQSPFYLSPQEGLKVYNYNQNKSRQLLQQAGFKYNSKGELLDRDNHRVKFKILVKAEEKARVDAAVQIQQDLQKIGIKTDLQILSFNTITNKLQQRDWECYVGGFGGGGSIEPHSSFNVWSSQGSLHQFNQGQLPGEKTIQGWQVSDWEKEIDRLFAAGAKELDEAKRKEIYGQFQQIIAEQVPLIYLINPLALEAVRDRIQNIKFSAQGGAFWNFYELKLANN